MEKIKWPASKMEGVKLEGNWTVQEKLEKQGNSSSTCYKVTSPSGIGFLKAFDYREAIKPGAGSYGQIRAQWLYDTERSLLESCSNRIDSVVNILATGEYYFEPRILDNKVEYFICEFSDHGDVLECLSNEHLIELEAKFLSLEDIFDGLHLLHADGIYHLDLKTENLLYFANERLTKIADFGSARRNFGLVQDFIHDDFNSITSTKQYAPPEVLYNNKDWTNDFDEYRKKVDLYLVGNIIVKYFTGFSYTSLLEINTSRFNDWKNPINHGKYEQILLSLVSAAGDVLIVIEKEIISINKECNNPLTDQQIKELVKIIKQLCHPNPIERGHPEELARRNGDNGLYRYRDKFSTYKESAQALINSKFQTKQ